MTNNLNFQKVFESLPILDLKPLLKLSVMTPLGLKPIHAASGLVKLANNFYVIADDELSLLTFSLSNQLAGEEYKIFSGELPEDHKDRKKQKPDLESLTQLPDDIGITALLAVPSGSKANRQTGSFVEINNGKPCKATNINFTELYEKLENEFSELNIEGACFAGSKFMLLQRGNGSLGQNAIIELEAQRVLYDINNSACIGANTIKTIRPLDLAKHKNVSLGFTDSCYCDEILFFLAVAEESNSTYDDGQYSGSFIGRIDSSGKAVLLNQLNINFKPEGLWVEKIADGYKCYIVTDADDPNETSQLLTVNIQLPTP